MEIDRNPKIVILLYFSIILVGWVGHMDQGMIANSTTEIKAYFNNITDTQIGIMSAGNVIGNICGTILSAPLFIKFSPKTILVIAVIFHGLF